MILTGFLFSTFLVMNKGSIAAFVFLVFVVLLSYIVLSFLMKQVVKEDLQERVVGSQSSFISTERSTISKHHLMSNSINLLQSLLEKITWIRGFIFTTNEASNHSIPKKAIVTCGNSIEAELETISKLVCKNYVKSWCQALKIQTEVTMIEGERLLKQFLENISNEFLIHLDVKSCLPDLIDCLTQHILETDRDEVDHYWQDNDDPSVMVNELRENEAAIEGIVNTILLRCLPYEVKTLMNSPGDQLKPSFTGIDKNASSIYLMIQELLLHGFVFPVISILSEPDLLNRATLEFCQEANNDNNTFNKKKQNTRHRSSSQIKSDTSSTFDDKLFESRNILPDTKSNMILRRSLSQSNIILSRESSLHLESLAISTPGSVSPITAHPLQFQRSEDDSLHGFNRSLGLDHDTGLERGIDVSVNEEDRLFSNIRIPETRITRGPNGDHYVSYRVVYDALFEVEESIASSKQTTASCLIRKEVFVWRRFSEFVTLHHRLESNPVTSQAAITGLENPSKMKTLHSMLGVSKLSRTITGQRVRFLQRYLRNLIRLPGVCNSPEVRSFLDYDSPDTDSKVKSVVTERSLLPLGLDRLVSQGLREAVNVIKNVFPIDSYQEGGLATLFSSSITSSTNSRQRVDTVYGAEAILTDSLLSFKTSQHFHDLLGRSLSDFPASLSPSTPDSAYFLQSYLPLMPQPEERSEGSSATSRSLSESLFSLMDCLTKQSLELSLPSFCIREFSQEFLDS